MEFGVPLRLVGLMTLVLILSSLLTIHGRGPDKCDFIEKK